jgi:hypothetical protein
MGYTHYWSYDGPTRELSARTLAHLEPLLAAAYRDGLIQREYNDDRPPLVTPHSIRFNGVGEDGHGIFVFRARSMDAYGFCKTGGKPYDRVVMRVLLLLAYHLSGFELSSDGSFDEEWSAALDWFNGEIGSVFVVQRLSFLAHGYDEPPSVISSF